MNWWKPAFIAAMFFIAYLCIRLTHERFAYRCVMDYTQAREARDKAGNPQIIAEVP